MEPVVMINFHCVEATVRYLTTQEGGRRGPVGNGYRGQFHYQEDPHNPRDGFQYFPEDALEQGVIPLGKTVQAFIMFPKDRWDAFHSQRIRVGTPFQIQEGLRIVGRGQITRTEADDSRIAT